MRPIPPHLVPEPRSERAITQLFAAVSIVALAGYLWWRVTATLDGASFGFAIALLGVELWFGLRHLLVVFPALALPIGGHVEEPTVVPPVDVLVFVRDEPLKALKVCLKSCAEVRGRRGLAVVNSLSRSDVVELCDDLGIAVVDPAVIPALGTELGRAAELLVLVPASSWVSADIAVMAHPAFDDGVAAVSPARATHGLVWLVGTRGYLAPVFGDERLASRLDTVGVGALPDGPVVFSKVALREIGGVCWTADDPALASHVRLVDAGWRARFINAPGSYRMAPAHEATALRDRTRRTTAWVDARRPRSEVLSDDSMPPSPSRRPRAASGPWRAFVTASAAVERWSVLARIGVLIIPIAALLTERIPAQVDPLELVLVGGAWVGLGTLARRRATGRRQSGMENARIGFRALGADLTALLGRSERRHTALQNLVMGLLLVGMLASVWRTLGGVFSRPDGLEHFLMVAGLLAIPALIRDSAVAYRQQRLLPRVRFETFGRGVAVELSPEGLDVHGTFPIGSTHAIELELPLAGRRVVRRSVPATVLAHRTFDDITETHLQLFPDDDLAVELAYFCGVTAPTMRWHGIEPRPVRPLGATASGNSDPLHGGPAAVPAMHF